MEISEPAYWSKQYLTGKNGWDIGAVSAPLRQYFEQLTDKSIRILIPGAGYGWEAQFLFESGFVNIDVLDFAPEAMLAFKKHNSRFPEKQCIVADFFEHTGKYDLIVEQTFFCALPRSRRADYVSKMFDLLRPQGRLTGLLFNHEFKEAGPPFGGTEAEYRRLFDAHFEFAVFETAVNSIKPRHLREFFFSCRPK